MPYYWTDYPYPHHRYYAPYDGPFYTQASRSDADITVDVNNRLLNDPWIDATNIHVIVHSEIVTLTGTVRSLFQKRMAEDDAWDTPGVMDIQNNLMIAP
jgi:osmotically-inducible protein OsmY